MSRIKVRKVAKITCLRFIFFKEIIIKVQKVIHREQVINFNNFNLDAYHRLKWCSEFIPLIQNQIMHILCLLCYFHTILNTWRKFR